MDASAAGCQTITLHDFAAGWAAKMCINKKTQLGWAFY